MVSSYFTYDKGKVIQALRYHFISRVEIKALLIILNVFAIVAAVLFALKMVRPFPFLISSTLWLVLMIAFWYVMPLLVYRRTKMFKDRFRAVLGNNFFQIENDRGSREWEWKAFSTWIETPLFFHLYFNTRSFFIIPKNAFEGDDVHEARKIFAARINK